MVLPSDLSAGDIGHIAHHEQLHTKAAAIIDVVADYGATGDGIADDTAEIQAALTAAPAGSVVFFPGGTYKITSKLTVTNKALTLAGVGPESILLTTSAITLMEFSAATQSVVETEVRDLQIQSSGNTGATGLSFVRSTVYEHTMVRLTRINVLGFQIQVDVEAPCNGLFQSCAFEFGWGTSTGFKNRGGRITMIDCWLESLTTGIDQYGVASVVAIEPTFAGTVTTQVVNTTEAATPLYHSWSAGVIANSGNIQVTKEDSYLSVDDSLVNARMGITKKSGAIAKASFASGQTYAIAESNGADIAASRTFTNRVAVASTGTDVTSPIRKIDDTVRNIRWGTGSPESVVSASVGSLFLRTDGGAATTLYVKESGTGATGWVAK